MKIIIIVKVKIWIEDTKKHISSFGFPWVEDKDERKKWIILDKHSNYEIHVVSSDNRLKAVKPWARDKIMLIKKVCGCN